MSVSLVLPCYNPPQGWEQNVANAFKIFCSRIGTSSELIIVQDGVSATVTEESLSWLVQNIPAVKLVRYDVNRGKGYALRKGVAEASGDIIMYTDIDFPYTQDSMYEVYRAISDSRCDVGIGVKDQAYYTHVPAVRKLISRFLRMLTRVFLSLPITDTQCGLKGFRKDVAPIFTHTHIDRYLFDLEFVHSCFKDKKLRVKAIPVALNENVRFRKMDYRILLPEMVNFIKLLFS